MKYYAILGYVGYYLLVPTMQGAVIMFKRLLAAAIALVILLSILPASAFAQTVSG